MDFVLTLLLALAITAAFISALSLLLLLSWYGTKSQHWTLRARVLWSARKDLWAVTFGASITAAMVVVTFCSAHYSLGGLMIGIFMGINLGTYPFSRAIDSRIQWKPWLKRQAWRFLVTFIVWGLVLYLVLTLPEHLRIGDWVRAAIGLGIVIFVKSGYWIRWFSRYASESPERDRLSRVVGHESSSMGIPVRHVWLSDIPMANAMAFVLLGDLLFTKRLLEILSDDELTTICRHELAHLAEPRKVAWLRMIGALWWLPFVFVQAMFAHWGFGGVLICFSILAAANRSVGSMAYRMEIQADKVGRQNDEAVYAIALEKIYEANQVPAVMDARRSHPSLYDRMLAAGVTPGYPRPAPPDGMSWLGWFSIAIPVVAFFVRMKVLRSS